MTHTHIHSERDWRQWDDREQNNKLGGKFVDKFCKSKKDENTTHDFALFFMRLDKAAYQWLKRKIWPLYLAVRKKLTAGRENGRK